MRHFSFPDLLPLYWLNPQPSIFNEHWYALSPASTIGLNCILPEFTSNIFLLLLKRNITMVNRLKSPNSDRYFFRALCRRLQKKRLIVRMPNLDYQRQKHNVFERETSTTLLAWHITRASLFLEHLRKCSGVGDDD